MKRQSVRDSILLISFLLFPITQFYFSPYLIIDAAAHGIVNASLLVFAFLFLGGIFFGRAFCGWVMPCGGLQEICYKANGKHAKGGKLNLIKYIIWALWLLAIALLVVRHGGYRMIDPLYKIHNGISVSDPVKYIMYYGVLLIFILMAFSFGKRATCHYICWMSPFMVLGRKFGNLLRLPALRLMSNPAKCKGCGQCSLNCPMSLDVTNRVRDGKMENAECILCGSCIDTCRTKVIRYSFSIPRDNKLHN